MKYVFVLTLVINASTGFNGTSTGAGGIGSAISIKTYF
jgi:hypothetical protein